MHFKNVPVTAGRSEDRKGHVLAGIQINGRMKNMLQGFTFKRPYQKPKWVSNSIFAHDQPYPYSSFNRPPAWLAQFCCDVEGFDSAPTVP